MRKPRKGPILLVMMLCFSWHALSQGAGGRGAAAQQAGAGGRGGARGGEGGAIGFFTYDTAATAGAAIIPAPPAETRQKITVNGEAIAYIARAGYLPLRNATSGQTTAHIFFTSYTREGMSASASRPLVFFLGAAPGVAAAWQEFGGLGPKRMKWMGDGSAGAGPYTWGDNPHTLLSHADLVFVNPVGTGYSRAEQPGRAPEFWNTATDFASLGEFVRSYLIAYDRGNSPLFLGGEDFGTGRAAGLAGFLLDRQIPVQGIILLSMTLSPDSVAGDAQYITLLPNLVVTAWYQKKLGPELQAMSAAQVAEQARRFCAREYLHALYEGDRMTPEERSKVVDNLARLTGLSKAFIVANNLRITLERFNTELLRDRRRAFAFSDSRVTGYVPPSGGGRGGRGASAPASPLLDYFQANIAGGFLTAYETYLRRELNFVSPSGIFYLSGGGVSSFSSTGSDEASLAAAFVRNPRLRLFAGVNLYDLNAPFYAAEFTLAHLNVSPEVRSRNILVNQYEAGQMTYLDDKALAKLHADLSRFFNEAMPQERQ